MVIDFSQSKLRLDDAVCHKLITHIAMSLAGPIKLHLSEGICGSFGGMLCGVPVADHGCAEVVAQGN